MTQSLNKWLADKSEKNLAALLKHKNKFSFQVIILAAYPELDAFI